MSNFRTDHFQLDDTAIEILNDNGKSKKMDFEDIESIKIYEDSKYDFKKFSILYWVVWLIFSLAIINWQSGTEFILERFMNLKFWGILFTLGLLAYRPIFSIFPLGTFMDIQSKGQLTKVPIEDIVQDDRIHGLIERLKQKLDNDKIKIIK